MAVILITIVGVNLILILYTILKALYMILRDLWEYVGKRAPKKEVPEFEEDLPNDDDMTANMARYSMFFSNPILKPETSEVPSKLDETSQAIPKHSIINTVTQKIEPNQLPE